MENNVKYNHWTIMQSVVGCGGVKKVFVAFALCILLFEIYKMVYSNV